MYDCSLIIDHLSCSAQPLDGMGLFNYSYSLTHSIRKEIFISKYNKMHAPYRVNEPYYREKHLKEIENYTVILNELKEIECYFCQSKGEYLIFYDYPKKIIPTCKVHKDQGSNREDGHDPNSILDIRKNNRDNFKKVKYEENGEIITKNVHIKDFDLE
jgi:hypothetical protein